MERKYDIIWHQSLDSTNSEAQRRLAELDNLTVIAAKCQFAGRGQRGNTWQSGQGENLTFSIVLKFQSEIDFDTFVNTIDDLDSDVIADGSRVMDACDCLENKDVISIKNFSFQAKNQHFISMALAIAVTEYLLCEHSLAAKIKWPNDIYCGDRKICGILIENSVKGSTLASCIAGIGLNLNQTVFPADLPNPTSVKLELIRSNQTASSSTPTSIELGYQNFGLENELGKLMEHFDKQISKVLAGDFNTLTNDYLTRMYRRGEVHEFVRTATGEHFTATILGITPDFRLLLSPTPSVSPSSSDSAQTPFSFKEIDYII